MNAKAYEETGLICDTHRLLLCANRCLSSLNRQEPSQETPRGQEQQGVPEGPMGDLITASDDLADGRRSVRKDDGRDSIEGSDHHARYSYREGSLDGGAAHFYHRTSGT